MRYRITFVRGGANYLELANLHDTRHPRRKIDDASVQVEVRNATTHALIVAQSMSPVGGGRYRRTFASVDTWPDAVEAFVIAILEGGEMAPPVIADIIVRDA